MTVIRRMANHPEMQSETMRWCLAHDYAAMACSAAQAWLSEGALLKGLPIADLLDALGSHDDGNRGRGLALLACGVLESAPTVQDSTERLGALVAVGEVSASAAFAWLESAFWLDRFCAERAAEYVDFLLTEISPMIEVQDLRDRSALSLACEVAAQARWAALVDAGGDGGSGAAGVSAHLDMLSRIEEHIESTERKRACQAIERAVANSDCSRRSARASWLAAPR